MIMAACGLLLLDFGEGMANQFSPAEMESWFAGVTPEAVALFGRVFGALVAYGVIGALTSAIFGSVGGMIYPRLRDN